MACCRIVCCPRYFRPCDSQIAHANTQQRFRCSPLAASAALMPMKLQPKRNSLHLRARNLESACGRSSATHVPSIQCLTLSRHAHIRLSAPVSPSLRSSSSSAPLLRPQLLLFPVLACVSSHQIDLCSFFYTPCTHLTHSCRYNLTAHHHEY